MRKKIVAGNWKMNKTLEEGLELFNQINESLKDGKAKADTVVIAPSFIHLAKFAELPAEGKIALAAQNCSSQESGAFTGEVSASMVKSAGASYVILGHSERRQYFKESAEELVLKVRLALANGLTPIFCCGESLAERERSNHFQTVEEQLGASLFCFEGEDLKNLVIAYEPVWAIGTGLTASSEQAQQMHSHIRSLLQGRYGAGFAEEIPLLYGGSCNAQNAAELFSQKDVDGGLIGGASLKPQDFLTIINAF
jgi:triosephosphate isomerase (TIM)